MKIASLIAVFLFFFNSSTYAINLPVRDCLRKPLAAGSKPEAARLQAGLKAAAADRATHDLSESEQLLLERIYQSHVYGELHDYPFGKRPVIGESILDELLQPATAGLFKEKAPVSLLDDLCKRAGQQALYWLEEGNHFVAFADPDISGAIVKYIKVDGALSPLAKKEDFPKGHSWSFDYGVDRKGKGELHHAVWELIRSFEICGDFAAPCKIFIAKEAYERLNPYHRHLIDRFIKIGIVERIDLPIKIKPEYPDIIPEEKRPDSKDGQVSVSVLAVQSRVVPLIDRFVELLNKANLAEARELVERYLEFVQECLSKGIFLVDLSMNNVGIAKSAEGREELKIFDAIHRPTDFAKRRPTITYFATEVQALKAAADSSSELFDRVEQALIEVPKKRLAQQLKGYFEENSYRMLNTQGWQPNLQSSVATVQKQKIREHPLFNALIQVNRGQFSEGSSDKALSVRHTDGSPSSIKAGLKEYNNDTVIIVTNPSSDTTSRGKEWGEVQLSEELGVQQYEIYKFVDLITGEEYVYSGEHLLSRGFQVGLSPYRTHFFKFSRVPSSMSPDIIFIDYDRTVVDPGAGGPSSSLIRKTDSLLKEIRAVALVTGRRFDEKDKRAEIEQQFVARINPALRGRLYICLGFYGEGEGSVVLNKAAPYNVLMPAEVGAASKATLIRYILRELGIPPSKAWFIGNAFGEGAYEDDRFVIELAPEGLKIFSVEHKDGAHSVILYPKQHSRGTEEILGMALAGANEEGPEISPVGGILNPQGHIRGFL